MRLCNQPMTFPAGCQEKSIWDILDWYGRRKINNYPDQSRCQSLSSAEYWRAASFCGRGLHGLYRPLKFFEKKTDVFGISDLAYD